MRHRLDAVHQRLRAASRAAAPCRAPRRLVTGVAPHDAADLAHVERLGERRRGRHGRVREEAVELARGARGGTRGRRRGRLPPHSIGQNVGPAITVSTSCRRNSNAVTTPKLPPPPRSAQNRSGCSSLLARTRSPLASTTSAPTRLSIARPCLRVRWPSPPPSVSPPTPVVEMIPLGVASPCSCVARSTSPQVQPPPTRTVRARGSTSIPRIAREVDHEAVVDGAEPGAVVPAAADRDGAGRAAARTPAGGRRRPPPRPGRRAPAGGRSWRCRRGARARSRRRQARS